MLKTISKHLNYVLMDNFCPCILTSLNINAWYALIVKEKRRVSFSIFGSFVFIILVERIEEEECIHKTQIIS